MRARQTWNEVISQSKRARTHLLAEWSAQAGAARERIALAIEVAFTRNCALVEVLRRFLGHIEWTFGGG